MSLLRNNSRLREHIPEIEFYLTRKQGIVATTCGKTLSIIEVEPKPHHHNLILRNDTGIEYQGQFSIQTRKGIASRHPKHLRNFSVV